MVLGDSSSSLLGSSSGDAKAVAVAAAVGGAGGGGGVDVGSYNSASEEDNKLGRSGEGDRSFGGNRWPRQETLALLKIRSDMDQVFRDSSLKGPLWDEVSRKLAELGYNRSAKKCKEKFENVYKYHKRTKDGRTGKPEGKHYKFFDQLQALDHHHHPSTKPHEAPLMQSTTQAIPWTMNPPISSVPHMTNIVTSSAAATPINPPTNPTVSAGPPLVQPLNNNNNNYYNNNNNNNDLPCSFANVSANLFSSSTSSSTASEEYSEERQAAGTRKRKWKMFFKRLTNQVIKKQEELQVKFLEEIERRESQRIVREDTWRIQEMARINREHEILIQERSTAAAKDAAIIAFLQKVSGQQQTVQPAPAPAPAPAPVSQTQPPLQPPLQPPAAITVVKGLDISTTSSSSRWPKAEVEALIKFRSELVKYQENGTKGPLWEEISASMRSIGYSRNAKRCKEKWENINKYFKKVKENNKKRPEDSKTCPYFDQLDALYKEKTSNKSSENNSAGYGNVQAVNHNMAPLMVQPEQQWSQSQNHPLPLNVDQIQEDEEDGGDSEDDYEEDEEGGNNGGYEIVPNKATASMGNADQ